jgi:hypothetical protein
MCEDTTYIKASSSNDPMVQQELYSGGRGHGHCMLVGHCTDVMGRILAVRSGMHIIHSMHAHIIYSITGGMKSQTPSGGDAAAFGQQVEMSERTGQNHVGFVRLWRGTPEIGTCMVGDRGYIPPDRMTVGTNNRTVRDFCRENNVLFLTPAKEGEASMEYDAASHTFIWNEDATDEVMPVRLIFTSIMLLQTSCRNTCRLCTFLRVGVECAHASLNVQYKVCKKPQWCSR